MKAGMRGATRWVLKLGGSLLGARELPAWLDTALGRGAGRVVIVPGGGPFADAVRAAQPRLRFGEQAAHDMALLAMASSAHVLMDLRPALCPAGDAAAAGRVLDGGGCAVWMPDPLAMRSHADVEAGWDTTSDSLAAWLAGRLGARNLALVKSTPADALRRDLQTLAADGVVDKAFPHHARTAGVAVTLFARAGHERFGERLAAG